MRESVTWWFIWAEGYFNGYVETHLRFNEGQLQSGDEIHTKARRATILEIGTQEFGEPPLEVVTALQNLGLEQLDVLFNRMLNPRLGTWKGFRKLIPQPEAEVAETKSKSQRRRVHAANP